MLLLVGMKKLHFISIGMALILVSLLVIPLEWSYLTVDVEQPNINLPSAYAGVDDRRAVPPRQPDARAQELLYYLIERQSGKYLAAVPSSMVGADMVLETGEPVLYMGGFNGGDPVVDAADLSELVGAGDLTFILYGDARSPNQNEINTWLRANCTVVPQFSQPNRQVRSWQHDEPGQGGMMLFECGP
jgi:hypothetical protein